MSGMTISELARRTGVPPSTLRYYEAVGVLPADRTANGYRTYDPVAVDRLAFIARAKSLALSLADIRDLITAWRSEPCSQVKAEYRSTLTRRRVEVDRRIAALDSLRATLTDAITHLDALPDRESGCDADCAPADRPAPALACTLGSVDDYTERIGAWHRLLVDAESTRAARGARIMLPIDRLAEAASLASAEQRCCAFLDFSFDLHGETFHLTISAPAEAADVLDALLPPTGGVVADGRAARLSHRPGR